MNKKKYPKIVPKYLYDKQGKPIAVYLDYDVYKSIYEEIESLEKKIDVQKQKIKKNTAKNL